MSSARKYLVIVFIQSGSQSGIVWDNKEILKRRKSWQKNEKWNSCLTLWTNMFFPILHFTEQNKNEQHLHNGRLLLKIWQKTKAWTPRKPNKQKHRTRLTRLEQYFEFLSVTENNVLMHGLQRAWVIIMLFLNGQTSGCGFMWFQLCSAVSSCQYKCQN